MVVDFMKRSRERVRGLEEFRRRGELYVGSYVVQWVDGVMRWECRFPRRRMGASE